MKVYVVRDGVFTLNNGKVASNLLHYEAFGKRYLVTYDEVVIVGRLFRKEDPTALPVEGDGVSFYELPGYHGPVGFIRNIPTILRRVAGSVNRDAAYVLRVPSTLPSLYAYILKFRKIPFAVEVVGDPEDAYSGKALGNRFLGFLFQRLFTSMMRWQCLNASTAAYVTGEALQRKYPCANRDAMFAFTSIDLTRDTYADSPKQWTLGSKARLVITGNMQKNLKGHDLLLQAIAKLKQRGVDVELTIIGFGEKKAFFEAMARDLGIMDRVTFLGKVSAGKAIRDLLDESDLFVLPSRQEGLPRALLEAMARGLPAIASDVGGTSELLDDVGLIKPNDAVELELRIEKFINSKEIMDNQAERNLGIAHRYSIERVSLERKKFYDRLAAQQTSSVDSCVQGG